MIYTCGYDSPIGCLTLASEQGKLTGLWFEGQKYYADTISGEDTENIKNTEHTEETNDTKEYTKKQIPVFEETKRWLDIYFEGRDPGFTPPLLMKTTDFRKAVWEIMLTIPYGHTMTYGEIAQIIAKRKNLQRMSAQAVGGAVGHNSISIIIPCHRVVGTNGSLTGYAGGMAKKVWLLEHEGIDLETSGFFVPSKGTAL